MGVRPSVRGTVMNPVDHPHGGGEGKNKSAGRHPVTPWGVPTKGHRTRNKKKAFEPSHHPSSQEVAESLRSHSEQKFEEGSFRRTAPSCPHRGNERGRRKGSHQDVVARRAPSSPTWWVTPSPCTMAASTCRSTLPSPWSVTSSASSAPTRTFKGHAADKKQAIGHR